MQVLLFKTFLTQKAKDTGVSQFTEMGFNSLHCPALFFVVGLSLEFTYEIHANLLNCYRNRALLPDKNFLRCANSKKKYK